MINARGWGWLQIGLMRSGKLLAEESPSALLTTYNCLSLEEVFLKLSRKQGGQPGAPDANMTNNISVVRARMHRVARAIGRGGSARGG